MDNTNELNTHASPSRDRVQLSPERKRLRKRRRIKYWLKAAGVLLLCWIFLWILFEFLAFKFGWSLWSWFRDELLSVSGWKPAAAAAAVIVVKFVWQSFIGGNGEVSLTRPKDMEPGTHIKLLLRYLINDCIIRNTILILGVMAAILLSVPSYAADHQWGERFIDWVTTPAAGDEAGADDLGPPNDTPSDDDQTIENADRDEEAPSQDSNPPDTDVEEEQITSSQLISAKDLLLNAEKPNELTSKEYDQIFFSSGEYVIEDWTLESNVQNMVHSFVEDKLAIKSSPNYEMTGLSQTVLNSVASASDKEAETKTATQLVEVINIRINAYGEPEEGKKEVNTSYLLAKLLRENYGTYGDAYNFQEASDTAAYILYGRSIIWGFKTLNYASGTDKFIKDLEIIAERYEKITEVVPANSSEFLYAGLLRDAFTNEANNLK